ncbi:TIGR02680 family protein [Brevibacillus panacihumi]|uniref:TIGR02680 family protein n=2 Tax=Brevibacillus panacihumi TaxID=497735 RepID=A0A3M8D4N8_9BACL|nr:TIGR02680 family protein [Brevibacillus panacihumi]
MKAVVEQMETQNKINRWQLSRAGLVNFWYYGDESFDFADGKLLLRGTNGSGKSVTMQSLLPVVLDGKKSPDRLDPFGSKARRMEDYLLGEKEVTGRDERTGYLYLEFCKPYTAQFLTIGIGLRAKRNAQMDFWGFSIQDNRRIGKDFYLYRNVYNAETQEQERIPLAKRELEREISQGGRVVFSQSDYAEMVNKLLFGFSSADSYEDLIKLLIQLRSPKLSKDFKPTVIYNILENSLPGLSDEELRPLSDAIESMDRTKLQLEQLERDHKSLARIAKDYTEYNRFIWFDKAKGLADTVQAARSAQRKAQEYRQLLVREEEELTRLQSEQEALALEQLTLTAEHDRLKENDFAKAEAERVEVDGQLKREESRLTAKRKESDVKREKVSQLHRTIDDIQLKMKQADADMADLLESMEDAVGENEFPVHEVARGEFERAQAGYSMELWQKESRQYRDQLQQTLDQAVKTAEAERNRLEAERALGDAQKMVDELQREQDKWERVVEEEKDGLIANLHQWQGEAQELKLSVEAVRETIRRITKFEASDRYEIVREPLNQSYQLFRQKIRDQLADLGRKVEDTKLDRQKAEAELHIWLAKKEPEPPRHEQTEVARTWLTNQGIPYVPLYEAVEYRPEVPEETRAAIESALKEAGLLDALIIPHTYLDRLDVWADQIKDRVIVPEPQLFAHTISEWLTPSPVEGLGVGKEDIEAVLQTVMTEKAGGSSVAAYVTASGTYGMSVLSGNAPVIEKSVFVGREARRRYRDEQLAFWRKKIEEFDLELERLGKDVQGMENRLDLLGQEYQQFPSGHDLLSALQAVEQIRQRLVIWQEEVQNRNRKVRAAVETLYREREKLKQGADGLTIPLDEDILRQALRSMQDYLEDLRQLETAYREKLNLTDRLRVTEGLHEDAIYDWDRLRGEENELQMGVEQLNQRLQSIDRMLASQGAEEIRARIRYCKERLRELPELMTATAGAIGNARAKCEQYKENQVEADKMAEVRQQLQTAWWKVFSDEYALGLWRYLDLFQEEAAAEGVQHQLDDFAIRVVKKLQPAMAEREREYYNNQLQRTFENERQIHLLEYQPTLDYVHEYKGEAAGEQHAEVYQLTHLWKELKTRSRRRTILLEYEGKRCHPYDLQEKLEHEIQMHRLYLTAEDRKIFEEVILQSVGRVIKHRIHRAEKWVERMNELMSQRNSSSGLTFSLKWLPRAAENELQMDTADLVEFLRKDPALMREQDIERITNHFRSHIDRAKRDISGAAEGSGETLHQIMKRILDYRHWFTFKLFHKREGEPNKELTDRLFFTFSGGEKAMAMYIPLLSAAYSRYLEADSLAPRIISLDEAFAGVDENNIRDMFELVEQLGFNYIMNSQALWGDYDTVSRLAICELIRPKNADVVAVARYLWEGGTLHVMNEEWTDWGDSVVAVSLEEDTDDEE